MPDPSLSPAIIEARALCPTNVYEIETLEIRHPVLEVKKNTLQVCFMVDTFSASGGFTTVAERVFSQISELKTKLLEQYSKVRWSLVTISGETWEFETGSKFVNFTKFLEELDDVSFTESTENGEIYNPILDVVSKLNWYANNPLVTRHIVYIGDTPSFITIKDEAIPLIRSYAFHETAQEPDNNFVNYINLEPFTPEGYLQRPDKKVFADFYGEPNSWSQVLGAAGVLREANSYCTNSGIGGHIHKNISGAPAANPPNTATSNTNWEYIRPNTIDSNYIDAIHSVIVGGIYSYKDKKYRSLTTTRPIWRISQLPYNRSGISPIDGLFHEWNSELYMADFEDPAKWETGDFDEPTSAISALQSLGIVFNQLPTFTNDYLTNVVTSTSGVSLSYGQLATDELVLENIMSMLSTIEIVDSEIQKIFIVNDTQPHSLLIETGETVLFETRGFKLRFTGSGENGLQNLSITIDDIDRKVSKFVALAKGFSTPIELVFRVYLSDDLSHQQNDPPTVLYLTSTSNSAEGFSGNATTIDVVNAPFPNAYYRLENFPLA